ncbi:Holliday junction resolvase RecU [Mycoplasmopsis pulmonis]|uniref:Holliday junction resolvase RecU n=1 Tax=Mycoplasmopsis pulmonis TaxID=2107 RepID=UPI002ACDD852|nr:Holliday junction resolvase RecU [Mycoplasmopsis pulmonis]MDZ7293059.1 Holliday junction resolvase RecU [Mycoplasmopsis pulmonis]
MIKKNRGMFLEKVINQSIDFYNLNDLALFEKKATPKVSKTSGVIIHKKSTVDYIGIYQGIFIAFEAKSFSGKDFSLSNIKNHQHEYLEKINKHKGLGFYFFFHEDEEKFYLMESKKLNNLTKKSISIEQIKKNALQIELSFPGIVDFLPWVKSLINN